MRHGNIVGAFLDVAAAFDRVWHLGLLFKLKNLLSDSYYRLLRSFLQNSFFQIHQETSFSDLEAISAGVPQGAILSPVLYTIFTSDMPTRNDTMVATYADDTAILAMGNTPESAAALVQHHLLALEGWLKKWRIKINIEKCQQVTFTLRRRRTPPIFLKGFPIPQSHKVKYLGLILDRHLTWQEHITSKRLALNQRLKSIYRLLFHRSPLSLRLKLLIYKSLLRPAWSYGIQLFGSAKPSNMKKLQTFQSKFLRLITGAPFYVSNATLHSDLNLPYVEEYAKLLFNSLYNKLQNHTNPKISSLHKRVFPEVRRLRRRWSRDLLQ